MSISIPIRLGIFAVVGFIAVLPFVLRNKHMGWGWLIALVWGGLSFYSVYLVQVPIQNALQGAVIGSSFPLWIRNLIVIAPSGIVQEFFKALVPVIMIAVGFRVGTDKQLLGPFAGVGFGLFEAVVLVGLSPMDIGWIAIIERVSTILFHTGLTAIAVGKGKAGRITWGLPLAMIIHAIVNFIAIFYVYSIGIIWMETIIALTSLACWITAVVFYNKGEK